MRSDVDRVNQVIEAMYEQFVKSLKNPSQRHPSPTKSTPIDQHVQAVTLAPAASAVATSWWLKVVIAILASVVAALGLVMALVILPARDMMVPITTLQPPIDEPENLIERAIIVELFYALGGPHWTGSTFWPVEDKNIPHCKWVGLECDEAGRVIAITLIANTFNGTVPASIGNLKNLKNLWLSVGDIHGPLPNTINQLAKLEVMHVSYASLKGDLPDLRNLKSLKTLSLDGNKFDGTLPEHYFQLPRLEYLDLSILRLVGTLPQTITNTLISMDLSINNIHGTIPDYSSSNLKFVDLSWNFLHGSVPPMGHNLQSLLLPNNILNGTFVGSGYNQLKSIDLSNNELCGDFDLPTMNVSSLTHLDISGNRFSSIFRHTPMNKIVAQYCKATGNYIVCPVLNWVTEKCQIDIECNE